MKTLKLIPYILFTLFLSITITSCSGDDGEQGADGANGADGNANVKTIRFSDPAWNTSTSTFYKTMTLQTPQITHEDINFSAIFHYVSFQYQHYALLPVDNHFINGSGSGFSVYATPSNGSTSIRISKTANVALPNPTPSVDFVKIVVIKPIETTNTNGNSKVPLSPQQKVYNELQNANVDINDYYAVCAYYNIEPK